MLLLPRLSMAFVVLVLASAYLNAEDGPAPAGDGRSLPNGARFHFGSLHFRHPGGIRNSALSPDGSALITTGADGLIHRWNPGASPAEPESYVGDTHAALSADGRHVVVGDAYGRIDVWSATTGKKVRTLQQKGEAVRKLAFDPTGQGFAVAHDDGTITLRDVVSGTTGMTLASTAKDRRNTLVTAMRYHPEGPFLYVCTAGRLLRYGLTSAKVEGRGQSGDFALSADGKLLAGANSGTLTLWDEPAGKIRVTAEFQTSRFSYPVPLAVSPDNRSVAAGLFEGHIVLFDARSGAELKRFFAVTVRQTRLDFGRGQGHRVHALQFSHDGRWLISSGSDNRLRLWEVATAKQVAVFNGHEGEVHNLAFGPDNRSAFSGGRDGPSILWDLRPGAFAVKDPEELWEILASADAERAYRAVWALSENPIVAAELLRSKIVPVRAADQERARKLIADLNSTSFKTREAAERELGQLDERARSALKEALKKAGELELRRRLEKLLAALEREPTLNDLREIRAVQALELAAAPETQAVLRLWASGTSGARLTVNATAALARLKRRAQR